MADSTQSVPRAAPGEANGLIGRQVGDFVVERLIGAGGMGEVYLAEQVSLRRPVALKILRPDLARDEQYLRRFEAEAKAIAPIQHANIVSVYSIGQEGGLHFIAFEYVRGTNLRVYIDRHGPMTEERCLAITAFVAAALVRAAEAGIVHRDIKPENVLITKRGEVKVADFGLARQVGAEDVRLTQTGVTMGTPLYMSPEQIQGHALDIRSDIYSLGVMCYHMLAGEPPYRGETAMAVAIQHVHGDPEPLSEIRPDVRREFLNVIRRMMAKRPEDRYASAQELLRDIERLRSGQAPLIDFFPEPRTSGITTRAVRWMRRLASRWLRAGRAMTRPPYVAWTVALSLLAAGILGVVTVNVARSWSARNGVALSPTRPDTSAVPAAESGYMQLMQARGLDDAGREAGLWAVLDKHRGDDWNTILAAEELALIYLPQRRYGDLEVLATFLIDREDPGQQTFGYLLRGLALSRQGNARESEACFDEMLRKAQESSMEPSQIERIARRYFLAAKQNNEMLGRSEEDALAQRERFWQAFRPPSRPGP